MKGDRKRLWATGLRDLSKIDEFLAAVTACEGEVIFETKAGDHLVLNSELSQFVFLITMHRMKGLPYRIRFDERDAERLSPFLEDVNGERSLA